MGRFSEEEEIEEETNYKTNPLIETFTILGLIFMLFVFIGLVIIVILFFTLINA